LQKEKGEQGLDPLAVCVSDSFSQILMRLISIASGVFPNKNEQEHNPRNRACPGGKVADDDEPANGEGDDSNHWSPPLVGIEQSQEDNDDDENDGAGMRFHVFSFHGVESIEE